MRVLKKKSGVGMERSDMICGTFKSSEFVSDPKNNILIFSAIFLFWIKSSLGFFFYI